MTPVRTPLSPLRYPGGKQALAEYAEAFLRANRLQGREWIEPCAGGASMAITLLGKKVVSRATIVERDPLIYAFWKCVKDEPAILCQMIHEVEVTIATWRTFQKYLHLDAMEKYSILELGLAGFFFNRTNYSGIVAAKPIGGMSQGSEYTIDCRFTKEALVDRIVEISPLLEKSKVVFGDVVTYLSRTQKRIIEQGAVVYVDPPYYLQGKKLYRHHFKDKDHKRLARFLNSAAFPWLVSYDNCPFVLDLFKGQKVRPIWLQYTVREARRADELLITNQHRLPAPGPAMQETFMVEEPPQLEWETA